MPDPSPSSTPWKRKLDALLQDLTPVLGPVIYVSGSSTPALPGEPRQFVSAVILIEGDRHRILEAAVSGKELAARMFARAKTMRERGELPDSAWIEGI